MGHTPECSIETLIEKKSFTHLYHLAPEQIKTSCESCDQIDIWGCGILMYLIFSGNHPFKASYNIDFCEKLLRDQVNMNGPEWKHVSIEAKTLIKGMLAKNPKKRLSYDQLINSKWI